MITEIQMLLDNYTAWLKDNTTLREIGDWVEITTPYLDRHNDSLQMYARREDGGYLLTDDGYVIQDLRQSGCKLDSEKRRMLLNLTLNGFGVQLRNDALEIHASPSNFALQKHSLIQAMLAVNDLFYLAESVTRNLFYEDAVAWLDQNDVRYSPEVKFTGVSGYDHKFQFLIPKSRSRPERVIQTITSPSRQTAELVAFAWIDIRDVRPPKAEAYALLNDVDRDVSPAIIDALRSYQIIPVLWSKRDDHRQEFVN